MARYWYTASAKFSWYDSTVCTFCLVVICIGELDILNAEQVLRANCFDHVLQFCMPLMFCSQKTGPVLEYLFGLTSFIWVYTGVCCIYHSTQ